MSGDIREAHLNDLEEVAAILADGFHDDPVMCWSFNGSGAILPFMKLVGKKLYFPDGFSHMDSQGRGATYWLPPGKAMHLSLGILLPLVGIMLRHGGLKAALRSNTMGSFMEKHHPHEPHYYLFAIATRESARGQGVGGALLREGLAKADAAGLPCYLENSKEQNLGFYQAHGFKVMKEIETPADCPPLWPMWREPVNG